MSRGLEILQVRFRGEALRRLLEKYDLEIDELTTNKIASLRQQVRERPDLSWVYYMNHVANDDSVVAAGIISRIDPEGTRKLIVPASRSNVDLRRFGLKVLPMVGFYGLAEVAGIKVRTIVQEYQVRSRKYSEQDASRSYREFLRGLNKLRINGPVDMLIAPEGHRSDDGNLGEMNEGIVHFGNTLVPAVFVPIGIDIKGPYVRNRFNFGARIRVVIGETCVLEQRISGGEARKILMNKLIGNLVETLPKERRGRWNLDT